MAMLTQLLSVYQQRDLQTAVNVHLTASRHGYTMADVEQLVQSNAIVRWRDTVDSLVSMSAVGAINYRKKPWYLAMHREDQKKFRKLVMKYLDTMQGRRMNRKP